MVEAWCVGFAWLVIAVLASLVEAWFVGFASQVVAGLAAILEVPWVVTQEDSEQVIDSQPF